MSVKTTSMGRNRGRKNIITGKEKILKSLPLFFWDVPQICPTFFLAQNVGRLIHKMQHFLSQLCLFLSTKCRRALALYPGHVVGGKSGLVSTVCSCANDSENFPRTSPNTDKLHMVVMRRNNQTRYTACSQCGLQCGSCVYAAITFHYLSSLSY